MTDIIHEARQIIATEIEGLLQLMRNIDENFLKAVYLISKCNGKIIVTGVGKSGLIGRKISATFSSTGTSSVFLNPLDALHGDIGMVQSNDIILAISYSGNTHELLDMFKVFNSLKTPIVSMTGSLNSKLAQFSDAVLNVSIPKEACPYGLAPTTSSTATLALGDALALSVSTLRRFDIKQFARVHPHGTLGSKLSTFKNCATASIEV